MGLEKFDLIFQDKSPGWERFLLGKFRKCLSWKRYEQTYCNSASRETRAALCNCSKYFRQQFLVELMYFWCKTLKDDCWILLTPFTGDIFVRQILNPWIKKSTSETSTWNKFFFTPESQNFYTLKHWLIFFTGFHAPVKLWAG